MPRRPAIAFVVAVCVFSTPIGRAARGDDTPPSVSIEKGDFAGLDVIIALDTSDSTAAPSGADLDGDGKTGVPPSDETTLQSILRQLLPRAESDPEDSILAAEVAGVRQLLQHLDPRTTRVGIVRFSGDDDPHTPDAYTEVPLTADYRKVEDGLEVLLWRGPLGLTNMVAGVNLATIELLGSKSASSTEREGAERVIMFLSDGLPTLPLENQHPQNAKLAIEQAAR